MARIIEADVIQKIATESEWLTQTRIPYKGQIMLVSDSSGRVVNMKVGDGVNPFADLSYMFDSIQQNAQYVPITSNVLPTPVVDPAWGIVTEGTYTFGGVDVFTVPDAHWGIANYISGVWSLVDMGEMPVNPADGEVAEGDTRAVSGGEVFNSQSFINISKMYPKATGYYSFSEARDMVPEALIKNFLRIGFLASDTVFEVYEFSKGINPIGFFKNDSFWRKLDSDSNIISFESNASVDILKVLNSVKEVFFNNYNENYERVFINAINSINGGLAKIIHFHGKNGNYIGSCEVSKEYQFEDSVGKFDIINTNTSSVVGYAIINSDYLWIRNVNTNTDYIGLNKSELLRVSYSNSILGGKVAKDDHRLVSGHEVFNSKIEINVTKEYPLSSGYYTFETAINAIPESRRKPGIIVGFYINTDVYLRYRYSKTVYNSTLWNSVLSWVNLNVKSRIDFSDSVMPNYLRHTVSSVKKLVLNNYTGNSKRFYVRSIVSPSYMNGGTIIGIRGDDGNSLPDVTISAEDKIAGKEFYNVGDIGYLMVDVSAIRNNVNTTEDVGFNKTEIIDVVLPTKTGNEVGTLKPYPDKIGNLKVLEADTHRFVRDLSHDGNVILGSRVSRLQQSVDEGVTWTDIIAPSNITIHSAIFLDDGEILFTSVRDSNGKAKIFKTVGYSPDNIETVAYNQVFEINSTSANINQEWGLSNFQNIVVASEYGGQGLNGSRYVYLSTDYGETWTTIFDQFEIANNVAGAPPYTNDAHVHTSYYDRYRNRIWVCTGDIDNTALYYSDNMGATWHVVPGTTGHGVMQYTGIVAYPEGVFFGSDRSPDGVYFWNEKDVLNGANIKPYILNNRNESRTLVYGRPYRRYASKDEVCIFNAVVDVAFENSLGGVVVGFKGDKGGAVLLDSTVGRYRNVTLIGETRNGNLIGYGELKPEFITGSGNKDIVITRAPVWE